jgi:hypothetical protein
MSPLQERSIELAVLMELRLAFGPGTRLWALRSREELCYDWLQFKANQANASFRDFALRLYAHEKAHATACSSLRDIRRRIAVVLRAYRIKRRSRMIASQLPTPARLRIEPGSARVANRTHHRSVSDQKR